MTITGSRPRNRVSAISAPSGTPIRAAMNVALRLTISDSRTMAKRVGSPVSTRWRAEAFSGMVDTGGLRPRALVLQCQVGIIRTLRAHHRKFGGVTLSGCDQIAAP